MADYPSLSHVLTLYSSWTRSPPPESDQDPTFCIPYDDEDNNNDWDGDYDDRTACWLPRLKSVLAKFHQHHASARSTQTQHLGRSGETFPRGQWSSIIRNLGKLNGQTTSASGLRLCTEEFGLGFCVSRWFSQVHKLNPYPPHPLI